MTPSADWTCRHSSGITRDPRCSRRPSSRTSAGPMPATRRAAARPSDGSARPPVRTNGTVWRSGPSASSMNRLCPSPEAAAVRAANGGKTTWRWRTPGAAIVPGVGQPLAGAGLRLVGGVGEQDDVAGRLHRVDERLIGFGARPGVAAEGEALARVGLGEVDVVRDHLRAGLREVVDHLRVHGAGPRPAAGVLLEVAQRDSSMATSAMSLRAVSGRAVCAMRQSYVFSSMVSSGLRAVPPAAAENGHPRPTTAAAAAARSGTRQGACARSDTIGRHAPHGNSECRDDDSEIGGRHRRAPVAARGTTGASALHAVQSQRRARDAKDHRPRPPRKLSHSGRCTSIVATRWPRVRRGARRDRVSVTRGALRTSRAQAAWSGPRRASRRAPGRRRDRCRTAVASASLADARGADAGSGRAPIDVGPR